MNERSVNFTPQVVVNDTAPALRPPLIDSAGLAARFAWDEFVYGALRNPYTRRAYGGAIRRFLGWCQARDLALHQIAPFHVGNYLDSRQAAPATKKLELSAIRHLFDFLVRRHAVVLNPAASVRAERHQVVEGKTPEISVKQARALLAAIDTVHVVGLRDRAIIGVLIYTAARVGAVSRLNREDFYYTGEQYSLRFTDKGGKCRDIPVRHDLERFIVAYLQTAGLDPAPKGAPLFRTTVRRTKRLTENRLSPGEIGRMVKRRMRDTGLPGQISAHSLRVTTITDLLLQGVPLADVQFLAGHADPRTTRLYDRRNKRITRNIVERISI